MFTFIVFKTCTEIDSHRWLWDCLIKFQKYGLGDYHLHKASQDPLAPGWSWEWYHFYMVKLLVPGESFSTHLSLSTAAFCQFELHWKPVFIIIVFLIKKCSLFQLGSSVYFSYRGCNCLAFPLQVLSWCSALSYVIWIVAEFVKI